MADNLLLVAWPNDGAIVFSPRYTTYVLNVLFVSHLQSYLNANSGYIQPTPYAGPTITTLQSTINGTFWKWIFRCQNCTTWDSGSLDTTSTTVMAWAISMSAL